MKKALFAIILFPLVAFAQSIEYEYEESYVDQNGNMVLSFYNSSKEEKRVDVCVRDPQGNCSRHQGIIPPRKKIGLSVGKAVPNRTFYWTENGTNPCPK